jgi:Membrane bound beta barrel domain (DUF5777)
MIKPMLKKITILIPLSILAFLGQAQKKDTSGSLLDLLQEEPEIEYAKYSFKTNRIINLHSLENTAAGVLDVKISHRFGTVDEGVYNLFGLDVATQRIGVDLGLTDNLQIGVNRNSVRKAYDAYGKYRILRQSTGKRNMPITLSILSSIAIETQKPTDLTRENYFSSKLFYCNQILIGRKFNDIFTLQITPTHIHRNLVALKTDPNDVYALGVGGRIRLSRRMTFNFEYIPVITAMSPVPANSLSVGLDVETGGHVFQFHFTNSDSMSEYKYIAGTEKNWGANAIRFGFNVSRVFTIWKTENRK